MTEPPPTDPVEAIIAEHNAATRAVNTATFAVLFFALVAGAVFIPNDGLALFAWFVAASLLAVVAVRAAVRWADR